MKRRLLPWAIPTTADIAAELRIRIAANRKTANEAKRDDWKTHEKVCERTAKELERLLFWIEGT